MRLIGMMDSPYVRRVAVSMKTMQLDFAHDQISVLREFEAFTAINPVVKAPTLITDQGVVLMDSTIILQYAERLAEPSLRLKPESIDALVSSQRLIGLALAACEKTVQIVYEQKLRPQDKQYQPWLDRICRQMTAAYQSVENEIRGVEGWLLGPRVMQADITVATAWSFTRYIIPELAPVSEFPALAGFSARAEALPQFLSSPLE